MYFNYPFDCSFYGYRTEQQMPPSFGGGMQGPNYMGPQNFPQGGQPNFGGMQGNPQGGPPMAPPPSGKPSKHHGQVQSYAGLSAKAIESGAIRPCRNRYVYIWLTNGTSFWAWLTYVGRRSVSGWRWNGRRWVYFGTDLRRIESFICY